MSDPPRNNGRSGIVNSVTHFGETVLGGLPPAFLVLVLLNIVFIGIVMWFLNSMAEQRVALVSKLFDACITEAIRK